MYLYKTYQAFKKHNHVTFSFITMIMIIKLSYEKNCKKPISSSEGFQKLYSVNNSKYCTYSNTLCIFFPKRILSKMGCTAHLKDSLFFSYYLNNVCFKSNEFLYNRKMLILHTFGITDLRKCKWNRHRK